MNVVDGHRMMWSLDVGVRMNAMAEATENCLINRPRTASPRQSSASYVSVCGMWLWPAGGAPRDAA